MRKCKGTGRKSIAVLKKFAAGKKVLWQLLEVTLNRGLIGRLLVKVEMILTNVTY